MTLPLFDSLSEITGRLAQAPRVLLCADFDGTLCPLMDRPEQASLPVDARSALAKLAEIPRVNVAILSGRERNDLQARIGLPGLVYAGNHGLEISGPGLFFVEPIAAGQTEAIHGLAVELTARLQAVAGVIVEDKGLTLSVHFRQVEAAAVEEVRRTVHTVLAAADHPFRLTTGDKVFEARPRVEWHKGAAVLWIKERVSSADALTIYLGDDVTDEDAFTALEDAVTVKVGAPEATAARYFVESPTAVLVFLRWLTERIS